MNRSDHNNSVRRTGLICSLAVVLIFTASISAPAASIHLELEYVGSTFDFVEFTTPLNKNCPMVSPTMFHNFRVFMTVSDMLPNEDFWTVLFNIDLGPGFTPADFGGFSQWTPNNPTYDPTADNIPPPPAPIYSDNGDSGASDHDLQRMFVQVASATLAQSQPGEPGQSPQLDTGFGDSPGAPLLLGDFYVHFDPSHAFFFTEIGISPEGALPWGLYVDGVETAQGADSFSANTFFIFCPEPSSGLLAMLAVVGLVGLCRRK